VIESYDPLTAEKRGCDASQYTRTPSLQAATHPLKSITVTTDLCDSPTCANPLLGETHTKERPTLTTQKPDHLRRRNRYIPHLHLLPPLPSRPLIGQPRNNRNPQANSHKQKYNKRSIQSKPAFPTNTLESPITHTSGHSDVGRKILANALGSLHLARPRLNSVDLRCIVVEHVCPDGGYECEEGGGEECCEGQEGAEGVFLLQRQLHNSISDMSSRIISKVREEGEGLPAERKTLRGKRHIGLG
jgi:hypothetical protein